MAEVELAVTERGTRLDQYTEQDVDLALRLLILAGNKVKETCEALAEEGVVVDQGALRYWRDSAFRSRYHNLRTELGRDVGEEIAGRAFERALQIDEAEDAMLQRLMQKVDDVPPQHLATGVGHLARAKGVNVEKAQLLRDRPTQIKETRSVPELIAILGRLDLLRDDAEVTDAEVVEVAELPAPDPQEDEGPSTGGGGEG